MIELQDYDTVEEAISLTDYGYASDSDLDEEEEETSTTVLEDSRWFHHPAHGLPYVDLFKMWQNSNIAWVALRIEYQVWLKWHQSRI